MDWRPTASIDNLRLRARLLARVREFFAQRNVLEVETPILSTAATTDPNLHAFRVQSLAPYDDPSPRYLHTSPEFAMKRLLAAGSGSIYQICRVFRGGESGRRHNAEFTMLEWYRLGFDHHQLMDEVASLVSHVLQGVRTFTSPERISYHEAFKRYCGLDPQTVDPLTYLDTAQRYSVPIPENMPSNDPDPWRDLLLTHIVEPALARHDIVFLYDYPATQAALARLRPGHPPLAERFELYIDGVELANGFHELQDATEQRRRFEQDLSRRRDIGLPNVPMDERLLQGLATGLPDCAGVALGFDRLAAIAAGAGSIKDVLAFPSERA
jgi:elongation factor P--(R)-beta-lysine ligase